MKKIPASVNILGRKFSVKQVNQEKLKEVTGMMALGACDYSKKTIYIYKDMDPSEKVLTLFHEVAHAIQMTTGLNQVTSPELAEIWCESMANGFMDLVTK